MIWQSPGLPGPGRKVNLITVTRRPHHPNKLYIKIVHVLRNVNTIWYSLGEMCYAFQSDFDFFKSCYFMHLLWDAKLQKTQFVMGKFRVC